MSLDKAIEHKKERRKKFYGAKAVDSTCRNHGTCPWCEDNRLYKSKRLKEKVKSELEEVNNEYRTTS